MQNTVLGARIQNQDLTLSQLCSDTFNDFPLPSGNSRSHTPGTLPTCMLSLKQFPLSGLLHLVMQMLLRCLSSLLSEVVSKAASVPIPTPGWRRALSSVLTWYYHLLLYLLPFALIHCLCGFLSRIFNSRRQKQCFVPL